MTKNLLITSLSPGIGKTTFSITLARKYQKQGKKVGYFKPITDRVEDSDAINAKAILNMDEDVKIICPTMITSFEYDMPIDEINQYHEQIEKSYQTLMENYEFLIIESCRTLEYLGYLKFSALDLAKQMNAKVLMLSSGRSVENVDSLILMADQIKSHGLELVGGLMTIVPAEYLEYFKTSICPNLSSKHGIEMFGLLPDKSILVSPTVKEIASTLDAKIIAGKKYTNKIVENYMVGAMNPSHALKYFRSSIRKAVITGGDRSELAIAALETDTSALILTGAIRPPVAVSAKAEDRQIPILLVQGDTFSIIKRLTEISSFGRLDFDNEEKLNAWDEILEQVRCEDIYNSLT